MEKRDDIGKKYYSLTVIGTTHIKGRLYFKYRCDCGNIKSSYYYNVISGKQKICGECNKHYMSKTNIYKIWSSLRARCYNPNTSGYENYGGRGIKVSADWDKFENFLRDMGNRPSKGYTIDRIDVNGDYCAENCKWATGKEQCRNRRGNVIYEYNGVKKIKADWLLEMGISSSYFDFQIKRGKSFGQIYEKAILGKANRAKKNEFSVVQIWEDKSRLKIASELDWLREEYLDGKELGDNGKVSKAMIKAANLLRSYILNKKNEIQTEN